RYFHVTGVQTCALPIFLQQIRIRTNRGSHFLEEGDYQRAVSELDTAVHLAELSGFLFLRMLAVVNRAEARRRLGQLDEAARDVGVGRGACGERREVSEV